MVVLLGLAALMLYGSMVTPVAYPAGQPWSGGILLWQYGPHMLADNGFGRFFAVLLIINVTMMAAALLGAARLLNAKLVIASACVSSVGLLMALFSMLFVVAALAAPELTPGPAVPLSLASHALIMVLSFTPSYRRAWSRPPGGEANDDASDGPMTSVTTAEPPSPPPHSA